MGLAGAGLVGGIFLYYAPTIREGREAALQTGLANMRTAIQLYSLKEGRQPEDLKILLTKGYLVPTKEGSIFIQRYLEGQSLDTEGYPIDPFGHRFEYDRLQGKVRSRTDGYQSW
ncbi:MAG: type II secretion system protein GspG [Nitrospiria bacterium]